MALKDRNDNEAVGSKGQDLVTTNTWHSTLSLHLQHQTLGRVTSHGSDLVSVPRPDPTRSVRSETELTLPDPIREVSNTS